ncbi:hypothetical protein C2E25_03430 [Geothermobacter hydrogeniphilus]|uniref:Response regulatory domain-containing protein n=1 Tax=Geothermobacter hydrogeniphilus TaxID=1969733 RepID=A0A2K2HCS2_9BACT|nr:response regulator [Geothermobacter hydrogeniphilus]PNU21096.1 hypothetical protein C2E25_03430 [Geothermobacter hydrogeniphilus]
MNEQILVIDDEESIRFTFQYLLADRGYAVDVAEGPKDALAQLEAKNYDLIFLDLLLGTHSGISVLRQIRQIAPLTPVVMVTGAPDEDTVSEAIRCGAFAYIPKPVRQETLMTMTAKALDYRGKLRKDS